MNNNKLRRVQELFASGGVSEVSRGLYSWVVTPSAGKFGRKQVTRILGGSSVWERDWDILCVLDGCRADLFEEVAGDSDTMKSVGSTSLTWISRTFNACNNPDKVGYITGNPFSTKVDTEELGYFHLKEVSETKEGIETVPPELLAEHAINVWRRRDVLGIDKLIIHFMQPHAPFRSKPAWFKRAIGEDSWSANIWKRLRDGEFTEAEVWAAYSDNLEWVLAEGVQPLQSNCDANIAMTADHGNAIGEWGFYGHPLGCPVSAVREVPWKTIIGTDEGTINPETETASESINIQKQLNALGYK